MTEKKTAEEFLKEKGIIKEGYSKWICRFEDGNEFDIGALIREFAAQELADYKIRLKEELEKRSEEVDPIFQLCFMDIIQIIDNS